MKRVVFYIVFILFPLSLTGQFSGEDDTIRINEVIIKRKSDVPLSPGYKTASVDSASISGYQSRNISDVLSDNSLILIKNYGTGGMASASFRGTAAGHTQITWNNININNPMTGQFDLSLIPAGFIDKVDIYYGGSSMALNSGAIGGTINLENSPVWGERFRLQVNPSAGSFGRFSGLVKINAGNSKLQSATKVFFQSAENNFPYLNTVKGEEPVREFRKNNQVSQKGFIEELYMRVPDGLLSAKFWYQSALRNLPEPIISMQGKQNEKQRDESFRGLMSYSSEKHGKTMNLTAGLVSDYLNYTNILAAVDSRNRSRNIVLKGDYTFGAGERTKIRADLSNELNVIRTNNYDGSKFRNIASAGAQAEISLTNWLITRILVRETLQDNKLLEPDFSLATRFRIIPAKEYYISASFSKISRIPSMNDMYWLPGGNPGLNDETGFTSEIILNGLSDISQEISIKSEVSFFHTLINNMIKWQPGDHAYWEAVNIGRTRSAGLESSLQLKWNLSVLKVGLDAGYSLTYATALNDINNGKQLTYIPVNRINGIFSLDWNYFYTRIISNLSGRRFLTADNSQYLPYYCVNDLDLGARLNLKNTLYDISLDITNIFNADYQSIAWYPMPGRAFILSVIFQLKTSK